MDGHERRSQAGGGDIAQPRLTDLRGRIETGRYDVKPELVAEAVIRAGVIFPLPLTKARRRD